MQVKAKEEWKASQTKARQGEAWHDDIRRGAPFAAVSRRAGRRGRGRGKGGTPHRHPWPRCRSLAGFMRGKA